MSEAIAAAAEWLVYARAHREWGGSAVYRERELLVRRELIAALQALK